MLFYPTSLLVLLLSGLALEVIFHEHLFKHLKARIIWAAMFLAIGISWDTYAILNRHWEFSGHGIFGIHIGVIPIEEFFYFLIVPYFALTVYETVHIIFDKKIKLS